MTPILDVLAAVPTWLWLFGVFAWANAQDHHRMRARITELEDRLAALVGDEDDNVEALDSLPS